MKIVLIGPGIMPIPPTGWGAVEILVWDTKIALEKLGHEVLVIDHHTDVSYAQNDNTHRFQCLTV